MAEVDERKAAAATGFFITDARVIHAISDPALYPGVSFWTCCQPTFIALPPSTT